MSAQAPKPEIIKTLSAADIPHGHEIVGNLAGATPGEYFSGLKGEPTVDWEEKPLKPFNPDCLPPHLKAARTLRGKKGGSRELSKLKRACREGAWTMEVFEAEVNKALERLKAERKTRR